jgi:hypothetical protein
MVVANNSSTLFSNTGIATSLKTLKIQ